MSLSTGARRLAQRKVLVKRLVAIEDLGDIDVLFTDKTGTLTEGRITFASALDATGGAVGCRSCALVSSATRPSARRPDRRRQPARPRSLGVLRCGEVGAAGRRAPRRAAVRLRAPPRVGARAGRRRAPHHRQGRARRGACPVHGRSAAGAGRAGRGCSRRAAASSPSATRPADGRTQLDARRRTGPRAGGLPDVRGPSEGRCGRGAQAACATERRGEGDHGRQRPRREEGVRGHRPQGERNDHRLRAGRARRRRARPPAAADHDLRPRDARAEVTRDQGATAARRGRGVPGRRGQRCGGAARRRRGDLGRQRDRRRQGRGRHRPARQGPRDPRGRHHRRAADVRQHDQVRADGHLVELREHVQRKARRRSSSASCRCCPSRSCSTTSSTTSAR